VNYFELYPGDYLRDTTRLSLVEHGAYLRLLMAYYAEEQPLPADEAELFVIVSAVSAADKAAVKKVAARFFPIGEDGTRRNGRADEEIAKAQRRIETARSNGSKGGRKPNPAGNPAGYPGETQPVTQRAPHSGEALHTPYTTNKNEASGHTPPAATVGDADRIGNFEGHDTPARETPNPVASYAIALTQAGFQCTSLNPNLVAYVDEGGTVDHLAQCAGLEACAGKAAGYVISIARRELTEKAAGITTGPPGRFSGPSKQMTGVANILGVNPHDIADQNPAGAMVLAVDRRVLGHAVPAEPRRVSGG
jgi:uncharacterized protein YdaU (DUF1376 family)